ncbi:hypothetical protein [Mesorhizobium sp. M0047]|uniref:hypothetical protein n=1 Tax=unclassified Mesorhizobium TaxID=325217 RepID=UPI003334BA8A
MGRIGNGDVAAKLAASRSLRVRNIRPYFIHYRAEEVLSCTITTASGKPQCIDARIWENTKRVVGFAEVTVKRVRHWRSDGWDLWELATDDKGNEGKWGIIQSGPNTLGEVSIVHLLHWPPHHEDRVRGQAALPRSRMEERRALAVGF